MQSSLERSTPTSKRGQGCGVTTRFEQTLNLRGEAETAALGERLSLWIRPGFVVLLNGDVGSGKSTLARALIRALMKPLGIQDIPSPTFSLVQSYDDTRVPIFHADLYRLKNAQEAEELGLEALLASHAGLIEWPDRLERSPSQKVLNIELSGRGDTRTAHVTAHGQWADALLRDVALQTFLAQTPYDTSKRIFFEGDASSRRYEKLVPATGDMCLLMDMPQRPDGPVVKNGKPYSQIAHLAENITAVVAVNRQLVEHGYSAPRVLQHDLVHGFGLIESLGFQVFGNMMLSGQDMREPLETAAAVLADMTTKTWPRHPEAEPGIRHTVHDYDLEAQLIEVDLLPSWYIPHSRGIEATAEQNELFAAIWSKLLPLAAPDRLHWAIRDYHSPNLIWIPERQGLKRVGIIDSQDAVMGHPAYDVASMLQDARVDMPVALQQQVFESYCVKRSQIGGFNRADFTTAYAILGAQRATKILGIFARLNKRDGKPAYLKHIPRVKGYLLQNLQHPALLNLKQWFETHLPEILS
jgi:N-acetylmuramate 1-kinase